MKSLQERQTCLQQVALYSYKVYTLYLLRTIVVNLLFLEGYSDLNGHLNGGL